MDPTEKAYIMKKPLGRMCSSAHSNPMYYSNDQLARNQVVSYLKTLCLEHGFCLDDLL